MNIKKLLEGVIGQCDFVGKDDAITSIKKTPLSPGLTFYLLHNDILSPVEC